MAFRADAEKYAAAGMNDTLPKPFDEAELLSKLASLMAGGSALPKTKAPEPVPAEPAPATPPPARSTTWACYAKPLTAAWLS